MDKIYKKKEKGRKKKWKNSPIYEKIMSKDPMEGGSMVHVRTELEDHCGRAKRMKERAG